MLKLPFQDTDFSLGGSDYGASYAYDSFGRFSQFSNFQFQVSYFYLPGSDLIAGSTASSVFLAWLFGRVHAGDFKEGEHAVPLALRVK